MKVEIPQIHWHGDRDRILSIDFYPNSNFLFTCGGESEEKHFIKIWEIYSDYSKNETEKDVKPITSNDSQIIKTSLRYDSFLTGAHNSVVNIIRFSNDGRFLASAGDDQAVIIWTLKKRPIEFGSSEEKVLWSLHKLFRGHSGDIYDLSWSPDSNYIISGSVDNTSIVWNLDRGRGSICLKEHSHFVQGVSWDPRNEYISTQSADKSLNNYMILKGSNDKVDIKLKNISKVKQYIKHIEKQDDNKKEVEVDNVNIKNYIKIPFNYYLGETEFPGFYRRLSWSPDGEFLLSVAGIFHNSLVNKIEYVVWGYMRKDLSNPLFILPTLSPAICIRFCPIIFEKDENVGVELIDLPYKLVFAVGTKDSVIIYNTQNTYPIFISTNIHIMQITDLAWKDESLLCASSSDGYISFFHFDIYQLGKRINLEKLPSHIKSLYEQYLNINYNSIVKTVNTSNINSAINIQQIIKKVKKPVQDDEAAILNIEDKRENVDRNETILQSENIIIESQEEEVNQQIENRNENKQNGFIQKKRITPMRLN